MALNVALSANASEATTRLVSVNSSGEQASGYSYGPSVSGTGRYVAFTSDGANLVEGDNNHDTDVFVFDRATGTLERVSVSSTGQEADRNSYGADITPDGRYVAFGSIATNLVPSDTNSGVCDEGDDCGSDVFVHDRVTGITERVSVSSNGRQTNVDGTGAQAISANGRYVVFHSQATNLVRRDLNNEIDIFVHDRVTDKTTRVNVSPSGAEANGESFGPDISADGRFVAFQSAAPNLVRHDDNGLTDIFVHNLATKRTRLVSVGPGGRQGNGVSLGPALSHDGRFVAFSGNASNLVPGDKNRTDDVFLRDRRRRITEMISVSQSGAEGNRGSGDAEVSDNGRFVMFASSASNLTEEDASEQRFPVDLFLRDRWRNRTRLLNVSTAGVQADGESGECAISGDGRFVAFSSNATNLIDGRTTSGMQVFLRGPLH